MFQVLGANKSGNRVPYGPPTNDEGEALLKAKSALETAGCYVKAEVWSHVLTVAPKFEVEVTRAANNCDICER